MNYIPGKFLMRVDIHSQNDLDGIQSILQDDKVKHALVAYHTGTYGNNPHIHLVLDTSYRQETLRARCKKLWTRAKQFSLKGYLAKYEETEEAFIYVFHERERDTFVCWFKNYSVKYDVGRWANQARPKAVKVGGASAAPEEITLRKKQRVPTFTEVLLDEALLELKPGGLLKTKVVDGHVLPIGKNEVLRFIIQKYGKNKKVFDKFIINRMYSVLAFHLFGEEFEDDMVGQVLML